MNEMTTHERMSNIFNHRQPDRAPITDIAWDSTIARWESEGMPKGADWQEFFGIDRIKMINTYELDTSPQFEEFVIEETDTHRIEQDKWGATIKNFKPISATFEHLEQKVFDPDSWKKAKECMIPDPARIDWNFLKRNYRNWREQGSWITVAPWFGYDIVSTRMCNSETILVAMAEEPEWVKDMFDTGCDLSLKLLDIMWERGYEFDELLWYDDMAYKNSTLFSRQMWYDLVRPYQLKTVEWAHGHGVKAHLHCCGNINSLIDDLIDIGIDMLNPLEVKAGMDPLEVKKQYGDRLALRGGFDARHWEFADEALADINKMLPTLCEKGGYVFSSDHSIPHDVSLENYKKIVEAVKNNTF